jgi:hypothetical protein
VDGASFERNIYELQFDRRSSRYFFLSTISQYWIKDENFYFVAPFVLIPGTRWLIPQYFQFHSVVHFNIYNCDVQSVHRVICLPVIRILKTYDGSGHDCIFNLKICKRRQDKYTKVNFCSFCKLGTCNLCLFFLENMLLIYFFFSGPADILCLTVASGWKKERCRPEIELKILLIENSAIFVCVWFLSTACIMIYSLWL